MKLKVGDRPERSKTVGGRSRWLAQKLRGEAMSNFYVYENWTHKRVRVHRDDCSYCNNGNGTQASHSGRNDTWHGPYKTRADAFAMAAGLNHSDSKGCANCVP